MKFIYFPDTKQYVNLNSITHIQMNHTQKAAMIIFENGHQLILKSERDVDLLITILTYNIVSLKELQ